MKLGRSEDSACSKPIRFAEIPRFTLSCANVSNTGSSAVLTRSRGTAQYVATSSAQLFSASSSSSSGTTSKISPARVATAIEKPAAGQFPRDEKNVRRQCAGEQIPVRLLESAPDHFISNHHWPGRFAGNVARHPAKSGAVFAPTLTLPVATSKVGQETARRCQ